MQIKASIDSHSLRSDTLSSSSTLRFTPAAYTETEGPPRREPNEVTGFTGCSEIAGECRTKQATYSRKDELTFARLTLPSSSLCSAIEEWLLPEILDIYEDAAGRTAVA